jgi:adenylylsulfate kinase-like enzyme
LIIWLTGQPGSGKTTLAKRFIDDKLIGFMKMQPYRIIHIDGDDLRKLTDNKDYSKRGRKENVKLATNMAKFLDNQHFTVVVSLVAPYRSQREQLKIERTIIEFYIHTTKVRGKEHYFVHEYEQPRKNFTNINTNETIEECTNKMLHIYRTSSVVNSSVVVP